jgi:transposase
MLRLPSLGDLDRGLAARIYLSTTPTDMRKGFDSLAALVKDFLGQDPLSGHLFLFIGRARDRLKILYWDADGFAVWYKRLEEGTFRLPAARPDEAGARAQGQRTGDAPGGDRPSEPAAAQAVDARTAAHIIFSIIPRIL